MALTRVQTVTSLFTEKHSEMVEKLILLHPVRNLPAAAKDNMRGRAQAASTAEGLAGIANVVAATAVAKLTAAGDLTTCAFIRHLVATTNPAAYAAACIALSEIPAVSAANLQVPLHIIGGEEDYLAGPAAVAAWAAEVPNEQGTCVVLKNVGHWGAVEAPLKVGKSVAQALAPTSYNLLMGTFRSPYLYTLGFDTAKGKLDLQHTNKAVGGHNWLDVSRDGKTLYTTNWGEIPSVSSYAIVPSKGDAPNGTANGVPNGTASAYPVTELKETVASKYLSGYVCSNDKAVYSACGPQVDVFLLDKSGQLKQEAAVQSFSLVSEDAMHKGNTQMDFGGLRHGGHSADLSPDGTKLYVADIGRNCVWVYHVDLATGLLTEATKNIATRPDDGPRHCWPHPNGSIVYTLQEHSSYVDVLRLTDDAKLEWLEGGFILPPGDDCKKYWADEVRLSPAADVVFGSVRGLEAHTNGYVTAWRLNPDGRLADPVGADKGDATHRFKTRTSGGWANAIAVCPNLGPRGEVFLSLTDSEEGFIQVLSYTAEDGFKVVDEVRVGSKEEQVGASVAVWL